MSQFRGARPASSFGMASPAPQAFFRGKLHQTEGFRKNADCLLGAAFLCGCAREKVPDLHAAEVPVHALIHQRDDPTVAFPESFPLQIAVYWSKPEDDILGLIHALRGMGIPFFVTRDLDRALQHRFLIIYPSVDTHTFTESQIRELTQHVEHGGSLFAIDVFAGALEDLFGFRGSMSF